VSRFGQNSPNPRHLVARQSSVLQSSIVIPRKFITGALLEPGMSEEPRGALASRISAADSTLQAELFVDGGFAQV